MGYLCFLTSAYFMSLPCKAAVYYYSSVCTIFLSFKLYLNITQPKQIIDLLLYNNFINL